jgi:hypothetical protein
VTFFFGSGSHERIMALIGEYSRQFKPEFKEETCPLLGCSEPAGNWSATGT